MESVSKTRLYSIYSGMKQRCYNAKSPHYQWYGGKGITICDEWAGNNGVSTFIEWALNNGYEEHLTIDRINPAGSYSPQNCRWITASENSARAEHRHSTITSPEQKTATNKSIKYKIDILAALRDAGYTQNRIRNEKLIGQSYLTQLRRGELVSWKTLETICRLLNCQPGDILEYARESEGDAE